MLVIRWLAYSVAWFALVVKEQQLRITAVRQRPYRERTEAYARGLQDGRMQAAREGKLNAQMTEASQRVASAMQP